MNRLKSIRQQQLGVPPHLMPQQGGQYPGAGQPQHQMSSQQAMGFRQQQARAQAQVNGLTQAQAQLMQQQMQQQQVQNQQAAAQHALLQQQQAAQRYAQQPGQSGSPAPRPPPPSHPMYQQQHMQLQAPESQAGPSHSPIQQAAHLMQQSHPSVMPSPRQKGMRPPSVNGPAGNQIMRSITPQQAAIAQQGQQYTPQRAQSPAGNGPPLPMAPHQQQVMQAQAQAMQHMAQQALAEAQARQQQGQQQSQQHGLTNHQLQQLQQQQMQQAANQMYSSLGLGPVNPTVMHHTAQSLGLGGRDVQAMSEDDRVSDKSDRKGNLADIL